MQLTKRRLLAVLATTAIVVSAPVCMATFGRPRVSPQVVLENVLTRADRTPYTATQIRTYTLYGTRIQREVSVTGGNAGASCSWEVSLIRRNFTPLVEGEDTIAGCPAWVLRLKPHRRHLPWTQLWVDKRRWIVLARRDWSAYDLLRASMKATSITFNGLSHRFRGASSASDPPTIPPSTPNPRYLPPGYVPAGIDSREDGGETTLRYSDGLHTISVVIGAPADVHSPRPSDSGQGLIVTCSRSGRRVAVIADLTAEEISKVCRSVR